MADAQNGDFAPPLGLDEDEPEETEDQEQCFGNVRNNSTLRLGRIVVSPRITINAPSSPASERTWGDTIITTLAVLVLTASVIALAMRYGYRMVITGPDPPDSEDIEVDQEQQTDGQPTVDVGWMTRMAELAVALMTLFACGARNAPWRRASAKMM